MPIDWLALGAALISGLAGSVHCVAMCGGVATGLGSLAGQGRPDASHAERARVNVRRRVVLALERVSAELPALGRYLTRTIKTGVVCVYEPDDDLAAD